MRNVAIVWHGYSCGAESRPCGLALLVVHRTRVPSVLLPGGKKAARNDPKCHYRRVYCTGIFVPVVAQPILDISAVSIAHKTVGVCLPRLRCGAVGVMAYFEINRTDLTMLIVAVVVVGLFWLYVWLNRR